MSVTLITGSHMRETESLAFRAGADPLIAMEHAAEGIVHHLSAMLPSPRPLIVCGSGNNGADGLAAARLLRGRGSGCAVLCQGEMKTPEGKRNLDYLKYLGIPLLDSFPSDPAAQGFDCIVDALWGTGFSGVPRGSGCDLIREINQSGLPVLSADVPSGLDADTGRAPGACVRADRTVAFHALKTGMYLGRGPEMCGERVLWDIGLLHTEKGIEALTESDLDVLLPPPSPSLHKGQAGRILILGGSRGKAGAAAMCALGALRAGAGLVTIACPEETIPVLQGLVPNAMCVSRREALSSMPAFDVLAAGCGMGCEEEDRDALIRFLSHAEKAVLDADALTLLAREPFPLPEGCILTPHAGEGARLLGIGTEEVTDDLIGCAQRIAKKTRAPVLLKSAVSVITDGSDTYLNITGSPALAKGGSGDALCGITAALRVSFDPLTSARLAALRLGLAGEAGARRFGVRSMLTGEMLSLLR